MKSENGELLSSPSIQNSDQHSQYLDSVLAIEIRNAFLNVDKDPTKILIVLMQLIEKFNVIGDEKFNDNDHIDDVTQQILAIFKEEIVLTIEQISAIENILQSINEFSFYDDYIKNYKGYFGVEFNCRHSLDFYNEIYKVAAHEEEFNEFFKRLIKNIQLILELIFTEKCRFPGHKQQSISEYRQTWNNWPELHSNPYGCGYEPNCYGLYEMRKVVKFLYKKEEESEKEKKSEQLFINEQSFINWIKEFMEKLFWYVLTNPMDQGEFDSISRILNESYRLLGCEDETLREICAYERMLILISYVYKILPKLGEFLIIPGMKSLNNELASVVALPLPFTRSRRIDEIVRKYKHEPSESSNQPENSMQFLAGRYRNNYTKNENLKSNDIKQQILDMPHIQFKKYLKEDERGVFGRLVDWFLNVITLTFYKRTSSNEVRSNFLKKLAADGYYLKGQVPPNEHFVSPLFCRNTSITNTTNRIMDDIGGPSEITCY